MFQDEEQYARAQELLQAREGLDLICCPAVGGHASQAGGGG